MTPTRRSARARWIAAVLAIIGWSALAVEFNFLLGDHRPPRIAHAAVEFFSFFTVISNLLVAAMLTASALGPPGRSAGVLGARITAGAVVYILMTGLVYTLLLRQSHGSLLGWLVDIALHQLVPLGYAFFWAAFLPKRRLDRRDAFRWLILPLLFAMVALVRGAITDEYTYPFLNPAHLGYPLVILNIVLLSLPFLGLGMIVVRVSGILERESARESRRRQRSE